MLLIRKPLWKLLFPFFRSTTLLKMLFCFNPLYSLIVSSSFCLPAAKSGIGVFGENNVGKNRRDDPENTDANVDRGTGANDLGTM